MATHQTLAPSPAASSKKKHSKKRKAIDVTIDASFTGAAAAPVVGYFPSGYDPLAAADPPRARLFRHEKHASRVELVVGSPGGGPDFVGRSYAGEAAAPQLCGYALGVLDKASGTLKIVPIAANKVSVRSDGTKVSIWLVPIVTSLKVKWYGHIMFKPF